VDAVGETEKSSRPIGVALLALITAILGVAYFSLALIANLIVIASLGGFSRTSSTLASAFLALAILFPIFLVAAGFWLGWRIAWWTMGFAMLAFAGMGLLSFLSILGFGDVSLLSLTGPSDPLQLVFISSIFVALLLVYVYLLRDRVRSFFQLQETSKCRASFILSVALAALVLILIVTAGL